MVAPTWDAQMARNPLTAMEYLDGLTADANIDLLFDQSEGDRVRPPGIPRAVDFDMIIRCHAGALAPRVYWRAKT